MKKTLIKLTFVFLVIIFTPKISLAASAYLESDVSSANVGDIILVTLKVDSEDVSVNSIEGDIVISPAEAALVNDFSLAKSLFTLWPRTPSLSPDGSTVSFVGGIPGGFNKDNATVFNIAIETQKEGDIVISPKEVILFANDGKGTKISAKSTPITIKVLPRESNTKTENQWIDIVSSDKKSPKSFSVTIGQDASMFEGRRFAFFNATDSQSGISYYEVSEDGYPAVRSGSIYLLQNQDVSKTPSLKVTAYDKAGNKTTVEYKKSNVTILGFSLQFIILLVVIVVLRIFSKKIIKNKKNAKEISDIL